MAEPLVPLELDRVVDEPRSSTLTAAAATGASTLTVEWTGEFDEPGTGYLMVGTSTTLYAYTVGDDEVTLTITPTLASPGAAVGDPVLVCSAAGKPLRERQALCRTTPSAPPDPWDIGSELEDKLTPATPSGVKLYGRRDTNEVISFITQSTPMDVSGVTGVIPPASLTDGKPPATSPTVTLKAVGVSALQGSWNPVTNVDPVTYNVYVSSVLPVVRDSNHLLVSNLAGTVASFGVVNDEANPGTKVAITKDGIYYMAVDAWDADGASTAAGPASAGASPRVADVAELNVEALNALTISVLQGYIANLTTDIALVSGKIVVGNQLAAHIVIDPAVGLILFASDGVTPIVKLDMTSKQLSEFNGKIRSAMLAQFTGGVEIGTTVSKLLAGAVLTLSSVVDNPSQQPTLTLDLGNRPWLSVPNNYTEYGACWDSTNSIWWQLLWRSDTNRAVLRGVNADGTQNGSTIVLDNSSSVGTPYGLPVGVTRIGSYFYVIRRETTGSTGSRYFDVVKYSAAGLYQADAIAAQENTPGTASAYPTIGNDGTNVVIGSLSTDVKLGPIAAGKTGFFRRDTSSLGYIDSYTQTGNIGDGIAGRGCGVGALAEVGGGTYFWIANYQRVYVYTFTGTAITAATTFTGSVSGQPTWENGNVALWVARDGSNFYSGDGSATLVKYSNYLQPAAGSALRWICNDWGNGTSTWTLPSPFNSITQTNRRWVAVTIPAPGSGTTSSRVFVGTGATQPTNANMFTQGVVAAPTAPATTSTVLIENPATSGTNPATASGYSTGTAAQIAAQTGGGVLRGDSTAGGWTFDEAAWTTPALAASWASLAAPYGAPQYKKQLGCVYFAGAMKSGSLTTTIFTLPVGSRPLNRKGFKCASASNGSARVDVFADGTVQVIAYDANGSNSSVFLDGISFRAEQ